MKRQWLFFVAVLFAAGCNTLSDNRITSKWVSKKSVEDEGPTGIPAKMVVTWTEGTFVQPGHSATRGFAGRVHFYDKDYHAIKVDGEFVVYGFDDTNKRSSRTSADKQFVFTSDHLKWRMSESQLGPSYNIWIPWDAANGKQKDITLVPVFRSSDGILVRGDQSLNLLPGMKETHLSGGTGQEGLVQQASHSTRQGNPLGAPYAPDNTGLRTTTINVPVGTKRHLQAPLRHRSAINSRSASSQPTANTVLARKKHFDQLQSEWNDLRGNATSNMQPATNTAIETRASEAATIQRPDLRKFQGTRQFLPPSTRFSP